jgi:hypothetical protein
MLKMHENNKKIRDMGMKYMNGHRAERMYPRQAVQNGMKGYDNLARMG